MSILNDQKVRPIVFALFGGGGIPIVVPFGVPGVGIVRPQRLDVSRRSRGAVVQTAKGAFLDDYGEGIPQISLSGHTGWKATVLSGLPGFKLLETMFSEYLARRERIATRNGDPETVQLWYIDTLNFEAFMVYPHEFRLERSKDRPLLYFYNMRLSVLYDLLGNFSSNLLGQAGDFLSDLTGGGVAGALDILGDTIKSGGLAVVSKVTSLTGDVKL